MTLALATARDAFLNLIADAKTFDVDVDGDADDEGRQTMSCTVTLVSDYGQVRELCDALGMVGPHDEWFADRIDRYVEMPATVAMGTQRSEVNPNPHEAERQIALEAALSDLDEGLSASLPSDERGWLVRHRFEAARDAVRALLTTKTGE